MKNNESCLFDKTGIVVIGRNEGERLLRCFQSIPQKLWNKTIYVDSGSTDNSLILAKEKNIQVLQLDLNIPFTAARARNSGFWKLLEQFPNLEYIHFIDGDCSFANNWLHFALNFLDEHQNIALVCGRRRESYPTISIYNQLCDIEWNTPTGYTEACGGDFLIKVNAFKSVNGFRPTLIAGEEPDLCYRLRMSGYKIYRLDHDMTWHDANITKFSQWWKRSIRSGHAYAEAVWTYRKEDVGYWRPQFLRIVVWGFFLPLTIISGAVVNKYILWSLLLYPLQIYRIAMKNKHISIPWKYAVFMTFAKFAEAYGISKYFINHIRRSEQKLIEYK